MSDFFHASSNTVFGSKRQPLCWSSVNRYTSRSALVEAARILRAAISAAEKSVPAWVGCTPSMAWCAMPWSSVGCATRARARSSAATTATSSPALRESSTLNACSRAVSSRVRSPVAVAHAHRIVEHEDHRALHVAAENPQRVLGNRRARGRQDDASAKRAQRRSSSRRFSSFALRLVRAAMTRRYFNVLKGSRTTFRRCQKVDRNRRGQRGHPPEHPWRKELHGGRWLNPT